jgi:hypothetical protein
MGGYRRGICIVRVEIRVSELKEGIGNRKRVLYSERVATGKDGWRQLR